MSDHEHARDHVDEVLADPDFGASCPLPEPPKVLRMGKALTAVFEAFLDRHMPGYNTADYVSIQVEAVEHVHDELNGAYDRSGRFFLVGHGAEIAADNDKEATE